MMAPSERLIVLVSKRMLVVVQEFVSPLIVDSPLLLELKSQPGDGLDRFYEDLNEHRSKMLRLERLESH